MELWRDLFNALDTDSAGTVTFQTCVDVFRGTSQDCPTLDADMKMKLGAFLRGFPAVSENQPLTFDDVLAVAQTLPSEETLDLDGGSSSSSDEDLENLHQLFAAIDVNQTGYVTLEDMVEMEKQQAAARGTLFDEAVEREELKRFIRSADLDRDDKLSFDEFIAAMKKVVVPCP